LVIKSANCDGQRNAEACQLPDTHPETDISQYHLGCRQRRSGFPNSTPEELAAYLDDQP